MSPFHTDSQFERERYTRPTRSKRVLRKIVEVSLLLLLLGGSLWLAWSYASTFPAGQQGRKTYAYTIATVVALFVTFLGHDMLMTFVRRPRPRLRHRDNT